jgi:pimeloyl-ACP methyl ester carboxylesterase
VSIELPVPLEILEARMEDGAIIRIRRHGNPRGPRLALSHGNGLAIDGYVPFWGPLRDRYDLMLFDFRNHGQNPLHDFEHHRWPYFVSDYERIFELIGGKFGTKRMAGVFHSLAAKTALMHTQKMGRRWDPLVLFEPPLYPRDGHPLLDTHFGGESDLATRAGRRPARYRDPMELAQKFAERFPRWVPGAAEMMARATLRRDAAAGDWVLACPREYEAYVFGSDRDPSLWHAMSHMDVAVKLICGDPKLGDTPSLIGQALAVELPIEYEAIPETGHFLQIERPFECIRSMESFLAMHGIAA